MQILIQVMTVQGTTSLRSAINKDTKLEDYKIKVESTKKIGRNEGWTKLHSTKSDVPGAINIEWESSIRVLMCRATAKSDDIPHQIIADFMKYLLARHGKKIESINIIHRG